MNWQHALRSAGLMLAICLPCAAVRAANDEPLPGTAPLTLQGDIASQLVDGVDKFLLRKLDESIAVRDANFKPDYTSPAAYSESLAAQRKRLAHILGVRDTRMPFTAPQFIATTTQPALIAKGTTYEVYAVRWPVLKDPDTNRSEVVIYGEGLLLAPILRQPLVDVVAIPDADQTPEQLAGLTAGLPRDSQFARTLAEWGCRVLVPTLISREEKPRGGRAVLTNREYAYRSSFELGRHLAGYEVQKVLAGVDWFERERSAARVAASTAKDSLPSTTNAAAIDAAATTVPADPNVLPATIDVSAGGNTDIPPPPQDPPTVNPAEPNPATRPIAVVGYGEGGMLALYAAALDTRIDGAAVAGYFDDRRGIWQGPIDRNVFGLLTEFGDSELAAMIAPRKLYISSTGGPSVTIAGKGGAPATLEWNQPERVKKEFTRFEEKLRAAEKDEAWMALGKPGVRHFHNANKKDPQVAFHLTGLCYFTSMLLPAHWDRRQQTPSEPLCIFDEAFSPAARQQRQLSEIECFNQLLLTESPYTRAEFMKKLYDVAATKNLAEYERVADEYRQVFYKEVIGKFEDPLLPANPRTRKIYDLEKWTGYEVALDVFPDVMAYGVLLVPKNIPQGERRPVVVCQHGLEGRPKDVIEGDNPAYHDYAARLADEGFITFAPQNLYIFGDRFRTLQRKANPLGKTLFSVIVPQHQQITDWLGTLPNVDGERIAFYGLSYGGKSAMRIPPLVKNYCLSICSADFNEWVGKNASTRSPYSYVWTNEYEIFEFDLGSTFNYAEMAALIAPRPFMVERGHFDGVGSDENVAYEFAKVRNLYAARLGLADRCEIEFFVGPHTINGQGTFQFLHDKLNWPASK